MTDDDGRHLGRSKPAAPKSGSALSGNVFLAGGAASIPKGEPVVLVARSGYPPGVASVEQRLMIVRIDAGGKLSMNRDPLTRAELVGGLEKIFRRRAERVACAPGGRQVRFGEVADTIGLVRRVAPNVSLPTPSSTPYRARTAIAAAARILCREGGLEPRRRPNPFAAMRYPAGRRTAPTGDEDDEYRRRPASADAPPSRRHDSNSP